MSEEDVERRKENVPRPHVCIFGQDVGSFGRDGAATNEWKDEWHAKRGETRERRREWRAEWHERHHHGGSGFWGLLVLLVGVMLLLNALGAVSPEFWRVVAPLWPALLIVWGAHILLGHHWTARLVTLLIAAVVFGFIIAYGLVRIGSPLVNNLPQTVVQSINSLLYPNQ